MMITNSLKGWHLVQEKKKRKKKKKHRSRLKPNINSPISVVWIVLVPCNPKMYARHHNQPDRNRCPEFRIHLIERLLVILGILGFYCLNARKLLRNRAAGCCAAGRKASVKCSLTMGLNIAWNLGKHQSISRGIDFEPQPGSSSETYGWCCCASSTP